MLRWAFRFLILALVAASFGFGDAVAAPAGVAKTLFGLCLLVFAVTLIVGIAVARKVI